LVQKFQPGTGVIDSCEKVAKGARRAESNNDGIPGAEFVRKAEQRNSEIIVMGAPRRKRTQAPIFGNTTDYVLKHAPCRVMVVAARAEAA